MQINLFRDFIKLNGEEVNMFIGLTYEPIVKPCMFNKEQKSIHYYLRKDIPQWLKVFEDIAQVLEYDLNEKHSWAAFVKLIKHQSIDSYDTHEEALLAVEAYKSLFEYDIPFFDYTKRENVFYIKQQYDAAQAHMLDFKSNKKFMKLNDKQYKQVVENRRNKNQNKRSN